MLLILSTALADNKEKGYRYGYLIPAGWMTFFSDEGSKDQISTEIEIYRAAIW